MKYALFGDIHSNIEALQTVLDFARASGVDRLLCLGDIVGYHADPSACIQLIQERNIPCIAGNHDRVAGGIARPEKFSGIASHAIRWTRRRLSRDQRDYLADLPMTWTEGELLLVHGALHPAPNADHRIRNATDADKSFAVMVQQYPGARICFFGHTHRPVAFEWIGGVALELKGESIRLEPDSRYLINPGSVGQSRDEDPRAALAFFDTDQRTITFHRVDYDRDAALRKARDAGLLQAPGRFRKYLDQILSYPTSLLRVDRNRGRVIR